MILLPLIQTRDQTACNITTTNGSATVTITTPAPHSLLDGDLLLLKMQVLLLHRIRLCCS
jgi:hypothetical protein